jgi:prophage antirepressor-like protein
MNIQNFAFREQLVRVIEQHGEPWFVGKDVCTILEIKKPQRCALQPRQRRA